VIQEASQQALKKGMTLARALAAVKRLREKTAIPICFMSYYNPIFIFGEERFFRAARTCGVDGVIVPDLPFEEAKTFASRAGKYGIDHISFVSPTTDPSRMKAICAAARGFLYYISTTGVTGARSRLPRDLAAHLRLVKRLSRRPVCVGFGVSTRAQVKDIQRSADGVIVGSAIVRTITRNAGRRDLVRRVGAFVSQLTG
jgi:tryptophan synthase alpha chain